MKAADPGVFGRLFIDSMFKEVFSVVENARAFIVDVLRLPGLRVEHVEERVIDEASEGANADEASTQLTIQHIGDRTLSLGAEVRHVVYDAYCVINSPDGDIETIVEMQNASHTNFAKRMWGYMSYAVAAQWRSEWGKTIADAGASLVGPDAALEKDLSSSSGADVRAAATGNAPSTTSSTSGASSAKRSRRGSGASSSSRSSGGRGRAYDFHPTYVIGITNFKIPEATAARATTSAPTPSPTQWFCMGFDDTRYMDIDIKDDGLRQQYANVTVHAVMQLPFAPTTADLAQLSAKEANDRYPRSHLWASLLRYSHNWKLDEVPSVFQQQPFAAVLEGSRLQRHLSNTTFMETYNKSLALEAEMTGVVESNELLSKRLHKAEAEKAAAVELLNERLQKAEAEKAGLTERLQKMEAEKATAVPKLRDSGLEPP